MRERRAVTLNPAWAILAPVKRAVWIFLAPSLFCLSAGGSAAGQETLRPGELLPAVRCAAKPEQSYALYVPSSYTPERRWPIVYAFDPGARGRIPVELMKAAAERYGIIIAGSNNSQNGPWQPQFEAAKAVWEDTHARLAIDDQGVSLAGFSGGARVAARLAQLCHCAQDAFLNGAGFPADSPPGRDLGFAVFATAGLADFNYGEVVQLDAKLDSLGFTHFLRRFEGPHQWAPSEVWEEAFAWRELLAMKSGRRKRDEAFLVAELARAAAHAEALERDGHAYFAWQACHALAAAFPDLPGAAPLAARANALAKSRMLRAEQKQEKDEIKRQAEVQNSIFEMTALLRDAGEPRLSVQTEAEGRIHRLREEIAQEKRPEKRRALERAEGGVFVSLLETGEAFLGENNLYLARSYLELATVVRPNWPRPHFSLARCLARGGKMKAALQSLKRAREAGLDAAWLRDLQNRFPEFAPLAVDPEFQKLIEEAPAVPPARVKSEARALTVPGGADKLRLRPLSAASRSHVHR